MDCKSKDFRANQVAMRELIAELEKRRAKAAEGGPPRARERHIARGKLLPRQRVMTLIDSGAPFLELSPLAANDMYEDAIHGAGLITFFFQAEDGIRDIGVTGVQTCALPILPSMSLKPKRPRPGENN